MDVCFLLLLICLCPLSFPLLTLQRDVSTPDTSAVEFIHQGSNHGVHSQEESTQEGLITVKHNEKVRMQPSTASTVGSSTAIGMSMHAKWLLSRGNRQVLAIEAQDEKQQLTSKAHKHDTTSMNLGNGLSADIKPVGDTSNENITDNKVNSGNKETDATGAPPPPPSKPEVAQSTVGKETDVNNSSSTVEKSRDKKKDDDAPPDKKPSTPAIYCGESDCEDHKKSVSACLRIPGDGAHKMSLFIMNGVDSKVMVKVAAPEYLTADPLEVSVLKGKSETIQFVMDSKFEPSKLDLEAVKNKSINVITDHYGECKIPVPLEYLRSSVPDRKPSFSSFFPSVTLRVVAYLVVFVLLVALLGAWLCYKCYRKKRSGDVKYQQLEMIAPGQSTPKERMQPSTGAWDEVWDDDWEDAEAAKSSSRLSQNLSARGLGARRGNKDGWDNSWED